MKNELFESEKVWKAFFKLTLPVVLGMIITIVYNMVDTYFVAQTGNTALVAGVSLVGPLLYIMVAMGDVFGLGGSSVISRLFGQKRYEEAKNVSAHCFYLAIASGVVLAILMLIFRNPMLQMLGTDGETFDYASRYYFWLVLGAPFVVLNYIPSNLLRTEGHSVASMIGTVTGAVVNVILDPILIFNLDMGAAGAAIATTLGNAGTSIFFILFLLVKKTNLSMEIRRLKTGNGMIRRVLSIGVPASLNNIMFTFSMSLTNRFLVAYGNDKVAAFGIALKAINIALLVLIGFSFGAQPLIGYNYGAGNKKRLKEIMKFCYSFICTTSLIIGGLLVAFAPQVIRIFMSDTTMIETGSLILRAQMTGIVLEALIYVSMCTFQAEGKAVSALVLSVSRQGIVFAAVLPTAAFVFGYLGILFAQPVSDLITAVVAVVLMLRQNRRDRIRSKD